MQQYSFMEGVESSATLPKTNRKKTDDPIMVMKVRFLQGLKRQKEFAALLLEGKPLPKTPAGRDPHIWFSKQADGWWVSMQVNRKKLTMDGYSDMKVGTLEATEAFYGMVVKAVETGELDQNMKRVFEEMDRFTKKAASSVEV